VLPCVLPGIPWGIQPRGGVTHRRQPEQHLVEGLHGGGVGLAVALR
jgi:hypothetical protein